MSAPVTPDARGRQSRPPLSGMAGVVASARWATSMALADKRNRKRLLVMAFGIALCMLVLLAVATINPLINSVTARDAARQPTDTTAGPQFQFVQLSNTVDGHELAGTILAGPRGAAPPPGTNRFPADGELLVSPALADALRGADSETLQALLPGVVTGVIDPDVLTSARDWTYYQGVDALLNTEAQSATGWGRGTTHGASTLADLNPDLWLVMITGVVVLLVPLLLFTALAGRIGAARRDSRSALLRLLGASAAQLRWIVAAEVALASVLAIALAALTYVTVRLLTPWLTIGGYAAQTSDIHPDLIASGAVVLGVPALAAVSAIAGARQATVNPLGHTTRTPPQPALIWRVVLLVVTAVVTVYVIGNADRLNYYANTRAMLSICALVVLDVLCVAALVGPVTRAVVAAIPGGSPAVQLARGRILQNPVLATRPAAALATVTVAVIALMTLLAGRLDQDALNVADAGDSPRPYSGQVSNLSVTDWARLEVNLRSVPGVQTVEMLSALPMTAPAAQAELATCDAIEQFTSGAPCADGDVFGSIIAPPSATGDAFTVAGSTSRWSPPSDSRNTFHGTEAGGIDSYLLTPAAVAQIPSVSTLKSTSVQVWMPSSSMVAAREATAWLGWQSATILNDNRAFSTFDNAYSWVSAALLGAAGLVLLICALAQWLLSTEYVDDRRRHFALARASGVDTTVLTRSVLVGALIPVVVGTALATGIGALLAWEIKFLRAGDPVPLSTGWVAVSWGVAGLVTLAVALGAAAQLRRSTGPTALRTE